MKQSRIHIEFSPKYLTSNFFFYLKISRRKKEIREINTSKQVSQKKFENYKQLKINIKLIFFLSQCT